MNKIKVGTIGYGGAFNMGRYHLQEMLLNPGFEVGAICDLDAKRLEVAKTDFPGVDTFTDIDKMLSSSDVELLVVILPHNLHGSVALQCLQAGRHVVVEKPFTITLAEADALIAEATQRKLLVTTYHNRHWDSIIRTIVANIRRIGRPYRWESQFAWRHEPRRDWWRANKAISGGLVYDWGAHFMEWMLQVMPYQIAEVSGFAVNGYWGLINEDEIEAVVRFREEAVASHITSTLYMPQKPPVHVQGTEGAIFGNFENLSLRYLNAAKDVVEEPLEMLPTTSEAFYRNVHNHLHHGEPLVITPEHARRVIQILALATRSAEQGQAQIARYP